MSGIDSDLIRGHIDTIILKTLLNGDKYGYEICHDVEVLSNAEYELKQPTLYSCLKRLEEKEFITSYWTDSDIGGRRHYYSLTPLGTELYKTNQKNWMTSRNMVDNLISDNEGDALNDGIAIEIDGDLLRGNIDTIILKTLLNGHKYGYEICKEVDTKSSGTYELKQPTLYSCLKRLEDKGLITSFWEDSEIGGKRHYYDLSETGKEQLKENQNNWERSKLVINNLILSDIPLPEINKTESEDAETDLVEPYIDDEIENQPADEVVEIENQTAGEVVEIENQTAGEVVVQPKIDELYEDASFILEEYEDATNEMNNIENSSEDATMENEIEGANFFTDAIIDKSEETQEVNEINYIDNEENLNDEDADDDEITYSLDDILPTYDNCKTVNNSYTDNSSMLISNEKEEIDETNDSIEEPEFDISKFISNNNNYFKAENSKQNVLFSPKTSDIISNIHKENGETSLTNANTNDNVEIKNSNEPATSFFTDNFNTNFDEHDKLEVEDVEKTIMPDIEKDDNVEKPAERYIDAYPIKYKADAKYRESLDKLTSFTVESQENDTVINEQKNSEESISRKERRELSSISKLKDKFESQGISVKIYSHADNEPSDTKTYVLTNKIKLVRNWITFFFMSFLLSLTYLTLNNYNVVDNTMMGTYIYFIIGFSFLALLPIISSIIYLINPFKKHIARFAPRVSILFALLFTAQFLVIIYSVNLQLGFTSFADPLYNHLNWIIPSVLTLLLIVESVIYCILYNSKKFHK